MDVANLAFNFWFDFFFPFAFENKHRFKNFFALIMEGIGTLWLFQLGLELSQRHGNHKPQRFDFPNEYKLNDGTYQFYFSYN